MNPACSLQDADSAVSDGDFGAHDAGSAVSPSDVAASHADFGTSDGDSAVSVADFAVSDADTPIWGLAGYRSAGSIKHKTRPKHQSISAGLSLLGFVTSFSIKKRSTISAS